MTEKTFYLKKIDPSQPRTIIWPVDIPVPMDGGVVENQTLKVRFLILPQAEIDRLTSAKEIAAFLDDPANQGKASPLLARVVQGFVDLRESEDGPAIGDDVALPMVLGNAAACVAITTAYFAMVNGRPRKN